MSAKDAPMLDAEPQQNEGRSREASGRNAETSESERLFARAMLLARAAEVGVEAAGSCRESGWKGDWLLLLQALCSLTARQAGAGDPTPLFTAERLRDEIASILGAPEALWWSDDSDSVRKKFANAWKALENDFNRLDGHLRGRAMKNRVAGQIVLNAPARPGTTNAMGYGLSVRPIELPAAQPTVAQPSVAAEANRSGTAPLEITYQEEMEVYPIPGLKRPLKFSLPGWRALIVLTPIIGAVVAIGFLAWFLLTLWMSNEAPRVLFQWTILTGLVAGMIAWICHPFYVLINDRIVRAPTLLEATLPLGHVLVLRREGENRVLRMVRFTAKCPICEGDITIEKGRRRQRGRLVGECGRNPVEHSFSFDFITGKGRQL
ncbi:hypothetical protein LLG90_24130 [Aromatoleum toluclasticum]|uniref:hypothetical protein n=1 Tax=Aromatoleum toluclasticum TaxID=92003 RepID=UPI001D183E15|nr:hypothetical protein [Aromatoleum toluclasticum]MCC4118450.1 hypothetical protein [Aromatoleum toluclasticum]